jgi:hypothetical protein
MLLAIIPRFQIPHRTLMLAGNRLLLIIAIRLAISTGLEVANRTFIASYGHDLLLGACVGFTVIAGFIPVDCTVTFAGDGVLGKGGWYEAEN